MFCELYGLMRLMLPYEYDKIIILSSYIHNPFRMCEDGRNFDYNRKAERGIRMIKERNIVCMQILFLCYIYFCAIDYNHHLIS